MYKLCKTEQSAQRQRQLEEGLKKVMLTKHFEEISVSDLCDQLQVPRKSFYRYFSSKDGALYGLIDHTMMEYERFAVARQKVTGRTLSNELESFFQFWVEHKDLLDALQKSGLSGVLIERSISHALGETVMPKRFLPRDSRDMQRQVTMFGVCGLMSMVLTWHHDGYKETPTQLARVACRLLGQPLFPNAESFF
jgi:AcrR family transcriptional regulator